MQRIPRAIRPRFAPVLATALLAACASSPDEGYAPFRDDATPAAEARADCLERAKFRDARGLEWTDWNQFADCMEEHGHRKR